MATSLGFSSFTSIYTNFNARSKPKDVTLNCSPRNTAYYIKTKHKILRHNSIFFMLDCDKLPVDCCYQNELNPNVLCITHNKDMGGGRHRFMY